MNWMKCCHDFLKCVIFFFMFDFLSHFLLWFFLAELFGDMEPSVLLRFPLRPGRIDVRGGALDRWSDALPFYAANVTLHGLFL